MCRMIKTLSVVILAAGQSTRMQSKKSKVLHEVGGLSLIDHVQKAAETLNPHQILRVISPDLESFFPDAIVQHKAKGTGDALRCALPHITGNHVLVLYGDVPLFDYSPLVQLLLHPMAILSMKIEDLKAPYGRLILDGLYVKEIKEYKEASESERSIPLANTGIGIFPIAFLKNALPLLKEHEGEFYLTDLIHMAYQDKTPCVYINGPKIDGINTRNDLARVERTFQNHLRQHAMNKGATLIAPETVFFSYDTAVSKDCTISPHVTFGKGVTLEEDVTIRSFCHLEDAHVKAHSIVGPFAHLRGGVTLETNVHVGNFVEIKGSSLDEGTRVKHLSYIGDSTLGKKVNIGAGTITCNYNGVKKFKTTIEDGVFVGSNSTLIAPITLESNSYIAAGTVVTRSVPSKTLAIARVKMDYKAHKAL